MTKFLIVLLLILILALPVLRSNSANSDVNQTYTRTVELCPIDISYSDLHAMLVRIGQFRDRANQGVEPKHIQENLTIEGGSTRTELRVDFSIGALSQGPELATSIRYAYRIDRTAPLSDITLWLSDRSRALTVSGTDRAQVDGLVFLVEQDVAHFGCAVGGSTTRLVLGMVLAVISLLMVMLIPTAPLTNRLKATVVVTGVIILICLLALPWEVWLPGTAVRISNLSLLARNSPLFGFVGMILALASMVFGLFPHVLNIHKKQSPEGDDDKKKENAEP